MPSDIIGTASALAPGTCGELVQGMIDDVDFLVTCPINQFSRVAVTLRSDTAAMKHCVRGVDHLRKTRQAVAETLSRLERCAGMTALSAQVTVANPIPVGKGMGSSSADITAAVWATGRASGVNLPPATIADIALSVEPTDGVMFPGVALFDHRKGRIAEPLGAPPPLEVIVVDRGGQVDTLEFNQTDRTEQWRSLSASTEEALQLVREGIRRCDAGLVGRGATISARAGRPADSGPLVERAAEFAREIGAVGVNAAHSGTVVGILLDARKRQSKPALRRAREAFPDAADLQHFRVIGGGVRELTPTPSS